MRCAEDWDLTEGFIDGSSVAQRRREGRFSAYIERLSECLGHADRVAPLRGSCTGLLLPGERKSVEPMAARLKPERTSAEHPSLLHFVGQALLHEKALLRAVRATVVPAMTVDEPVAAWIVEDTLFPKKGKHSRRASIRSA